MTFVWTFEGILEAIVIGVASIALALAGLLKIIDKIISKRGKK